MRYVREKISGNEQWAERGQSVGRDISLSRLGTHRQTRDPDTPMGPQMEHRSSPGPAQVQPRRSPSPA